MKSFKFYNPFKPHVVQFANGKFAVRKWSIFMWEYKEHTTFAKDDVYWWNSINDTFNWVCVDTYEQAVALRDKVHFKGPKEMKVEKVHG
jgi:hypothetical protein